MGNDTDIAGMMDRIMADLAKLRRETAAAVATLLTENDSLKAERDALREALSDLLQFVTSARSPANPVAVRMGEWQRVIDAAKDVLPDTTPQPETGSEK